MCGNESLRFARAEGERKDDASPDDQAVDRGEK